jgi:hemerythrin
MPMSLYWTPAMSTGLDWQDTEHRELFNRIASLLDAMRHNEPETTLSELFIFLKSYVELHFSHEEQVMCETAFPKYKAHKAEHNAFIARMENLRTAFGRQGASTYVVLNVQRWLVEWLQIHIGREDKLLAAIVLQKQPKPA